MPTSGEIRTQLAEVQHDHAMAQQALSRAEAERQQLLITASNRELDQHDEGLASMRREIERAAARAQALQAQLPAVEEREEQERQQAVHAEIGSLTTRYRHLIEVAYPQAAGPMLDLLVTMRDLAAQIEVLNQSVPGQLRVRPELFRRDPRSSYAFEPLFKTVTLPPVLQTGAPLWPRPKPPVERRAPVERPPAIVPEFGREPIVTDGRRETGGIIYQRQSLAEWSAERDAQRKAEQQGNGTAR